MPCGFGEMAAGSGGCLEDSYMATSPWALNAWDAWLVMFTSSGIVYVVSFSINFYIEKRRGLSNGPVAKGTKLVMEHRAEVNRYLTALAACCRHVDGAAIALPASASFAFGVAGAFWYSAAWAWPMLLLPPLAIAHKRRCKGAGTILDVIYARYGKCAHSFAVLPCIVATLAKLVVSLSLASVMIKAVTNCDVRMVAFLFLLSSIFWLGQGMTPCHERKALMLWFQMMVLIIGMAAVMLAMYFPSQGTESDDSMYGAAMKQEGGPGYLSMNSIDALQMGLILSTATPGLTLLDSSIWQIVNESSELAAPHGLWAGACACFSIPFGLGTACGIAARAWGLDVTAGDVVIGLVAPGAAQEYGGRFGAWMFLCLTVAGVSMSAVSQLEALSLLFSHDVYSRYMNQHAKQEELDKIRTAVPLVLVPIVGLLTLGLLSSGAPPLSVLVACGLVTNSLLWPVVTSHLWKTISPVGVLAGMIGGFFTGLAVCISMAKGWNAAAAAGGICAMPDGGDAVWVGNIASALSSPIISILVTAFYDRMGWDDGDEDFEWSKMLNSGQIPRDRSGKLDASRAFQKKANDASATNARIVRDVARSSMVSATIAFFLLVAWPSLALPAAEFSSEYFTFWVLVTFLLFIVSACAICLMPAIKLWDATSEKEKKSHIEEDKSVHSFRQLFGASNNTDTGKDSQSNHSHGASQFTIADSMSFLNRAASMLDVFNTHPAKKIEDDKPKNEIRNEVSNFPSDANGVEIAVDEVATLEDTLIQQECKLLLDIDAQSSNGSDSDLAVESKKSTYDSQPGHNNLRHLDSEAFFRRENGDEQSGMKLPLLRLALKKLFQYFCAEQKIQNSNIYSSEWQHLRWKARSMNQLMVGVLTGAYFLVTAVLYSAGGAPIGSIGLWIHFFIMVMLFAWVRYSNRHRPYGLTVHRTFSVAKLVQILLFLLIPCLQQLLLGGVCRTSSDALVWTMLAPIASMWFHANEGTGSTVASAWPFDQMIAQSRARILISSRAVLFFAIVCIDQYLAPVDVPKWLSTFFFIINHTVCPIVMIVASRHTLLEFLSRRSLVFTSDDRLSTELDKNLDLIYSLVPPFLAKELLLLPPKRWWRRQPDKFENLSLVQMDIVGFTALSSEIRAEELILLLNAIYTQIDRASARIGKIWKVETIGDCLIAVVGGHEDCEDHAARALFFACCIIKEVESIAKKIRKPLSVRVGVHSGTTHATVLGMTMPRYFIFGQDCEICSRLESTGMTAQIHLSDATAKLLPPVWASTLSRREEMMETPSGEKIQTHLLKISSVHQDAMKYVFNMAKKWVEKIDFRTVLGSQAEIAKDLMMRITATPELAARYNISGADESIRAMLNQAAESDKKTHRNSSSKQDKEQMENGVQVGERLAQYDGVCLELTRTFERCESGDSQVGLIFQRISSGGSNASSESLLTFQRETSWESNASNDSRVSPGKTSSRCSSPTLMFSIRPTFGNPYKTTARDFPSKGPSSESNNFSRSASLGTAGHPHKKKLSTGLSSSFARRHLHLKSISFENPSQLSPQIESPMRGGKGNFFSDDSEDDDRIPEWQRANSDGAIIYEHSHMDGPRHGSHATNSESTEDATEDGANDDNVETLTSTERSKHRIESNLRMHNRLLLDIPEASRTCHGPSQRRLLLSQPGTSEIRRSSLPLDLPSILTSTRPGSEASVLFQEVTKHMNPLPESDLSHRAEHRPGNGKETLRSSSLRVVSPSNLGLDAADILPRKVDVPTNLQVFEPEAAPADGAVRDFSSKKSSASASRSKAKTERSRGSVSSHGGSSVSGANSPEPRSKRNSIHWDGVLDMSVHRLGSGQKTSWQTFLRGLTETRVNLTDVLTENKYSKKKSLHLEEATRQSLSRDSNTATRTKCPSAEKASTEPEAEFSHRTVQPDENYKFQLALKSLDGLRYTVVNFFLAALASVAAVHSLVLFIVAKSTTDWAVASVSLAYGIICVLVLILHRRTRIVTHKVESGGTTAREVIFGRSASDEITNRQTIASNYKVVWLSEAVLFLSPLAFVGAMNTSYSHTVLLWSFGAPILRANFLWSRHDRWWKIWLVLYIVFLAGLHLIQHQIVNDCERDFPRTERVQGWEYLLYTMHHLVPTTVFLVPLSLICKKLLSDEKKDQVILTERQANMELERKLVEALVPKKIAERLRNGDKHIADNYEHTTVLFIYLDGYEEEFRHGANLEKAMAWVQTVFYHIDEVLDKGFRNKILKVSAFQKFYLAVSGCPDKQPRHAQYSAEAACMINERIHTIMRPNGQPTRLKIGLSSGKLSAGVVGTSSPRFSTFGDTVNTASRMASTSQSTGDDGLWSCQMTSRTAKLLPKPFVDKLSSHFSTHLVKRSNAVLVKGKGHMTTYFLQKTDKSNDRANASRAIAALTQSSSL